MLYPVEPTVLVRLFIYKNKNRTATSGFHKGKPLTILGAKKLNVCVRHGNRWILLANITVLIFLFRENVVLSKLNS